jgi:hypothetical protein
MFLILSRREAACRRTLKNSPLLREGSLEGFFNTEKARVLIFARR